MSDSDTELSTTSEKGFDPKLLKTQIRVRQPLLKLIKSWGPGVTVKVGVEAVKDFAGIVSETQREGESEAMVLVNHIIPYNAPMPSGLDLSQMIKVKVFFPKNGVELNGRWAEETEVLIWQDRLPKSWFTGSLEWRHETEGSQRINVYDTQGHTLD